MSGNDRISHSNNRHLPVQQLLTGEYLYAQVGFVIVLSGISIHFRNIWRHSKSLVNAG